MLYRFVLYNYIYPDRNSDLDAQTRPIWIFSLIPNRLPHLKCLDETWAQYSCPINQQCIYSKNRQDSKEASVLRSEDSSDLRFLIFLEASLADGSSSLPFSLTQA